MDEDTSGPLLTQIVNPFPKETDIESDPDSVKVRETKAITLQFETHVKECLLNLNSNHFNLSTQSETNHPNPLLITGMDINLNTRKRPIVADHTSGLTMHDDIVGQGLLNNQD